MFFLATHEPWLVCSPAFRRLERLGPAEAGTPSCQRFMVPMRGIKVVQALSLPMNLRGKRRRSGGFGLENEIVLTGQFLEQSLFGLRHFLFILLEALLDVSDSVNHQTPEQFGQLARQRQIGNEPTAPPFEPPIKTAEGLVHTASHA